VARVSGLDLETYFQKHVFIPLSISDLTFWTKKNPDIEARMASLSMRDPAVSNSAGKAVPNAGYNMNVGV
jgi:CubicO group peptidase (beta-lactamase class C family)